MIGLDSSVIIKTTSPKKKIKPDIVIDKSNDEMSKFLDEDL